MPLEDSTTLGIPGNVPDMGRWAASIFWTVVGWGVVALLAPAFKAVFKAIFTVEVEEFWNGRVQPFLMQNGLPWVAKALEFAPTFWGGVALTILLFVCVDFARVRFAQIPSDDVDQPAMIPRNPDVPHQLTKLQETMAENSNLKAQLASLNATLESESEHRKSAAKIIQLERKIEEVAHWLDEYNRFAEEMVTYVRRGEFDPTDANPNEVWHSVIRPAIDGMHSIRTVDIRGVMREFLDEDFDFESTPALSNNPYSVKPPALDRLPNDEFKFEYKRAWERMKRAEPVVSGLLDKLRGAIEAEKSKIARYATG